MTKQTFAFCGCVLLLALLAFWLPDIATAVAAQSGAATCSCGCGGTPRPACAHSCGGNPCTGGAITNSRIIIGEVVENAPASFTVVAPNGGTLSGFVVEFDDGQRATTDERGGATFIPTGRRTLKATIPAITATNVRVVTQDQANRTASRIPRFTTAGNQMSLARAGFFDGRAGNTQASVGNVSCPIMFEAPHQAILTVPEGTPVGTSQLRIEDQGRMVEQPIDVLRFSLQADRLQLLRGETTQGKAIIEGAGPSLAGGVVRIQNLSTEIVELRLVSGRGTDKLETRIEPSMIQNSRVEIPLMLRGRRGGSFQVVGGVYDPQALASATCSCGCGGTPRPACAHSCGGNPCTGATVRP
jgi:hypothetical protein